MKIDWTMVISLAIALIAVKVIDKLFLDAALEKVGTYEEYEELT